jgi:hypothetical protein
MSALEREGKKKKSVFRKNGLKKCFFNSPGPARLDWSISGCTILRLALMNLTVCTKTGSETEKSAALQFSDKPTLRSDKTR